VTVAMYDPATGIRAGDIQAAIHYTVETFKETLARFEENKKHVFPAFRKDPDLSSMVEPYAELMMDSVAGNIEWSVACKRYSLFPDEVG